MWKDKEMNERICKKLNEWLKEYVKEIMNKIYVKV